MSGSEDTENPNFKQYQKPPAASRSRLSNYGFRVQGLGFRVDSGVRPKVDKHESDKHESRPITAMNPSNSSLKIL